MQKEIHQEDHQKDREEAHHHHQEAPHLEKEEMTA